MGQESRVLCTCCVVWFGTKGVVNPRYFGLFSKIAGIKKLAYRWDRLESMRGVRNVLYDLVLVEYLRHLECEVL